MSGAMTEDWSVSPVTAWLNHVTEGDYRGFTQDYYVPAEDETDPDIIANARKWYVVLPAHASDQGDYTLSVTINSEAEPRTVVVPQQYMNWQPGFEYTYVFKITDTGGITFDGLEVVKIYPWNTENDERKVYNW